MVLAGITNYTRLWQLPLFILFLGGWLIGGAYLTRWALRRFAQLPKSKSPTSRCAKVNLLAGGAGLAGAGIIMLFFVAVGVNFGPFWLIWIGIGLAPPVVVCMSWLSHAAILNLPGRTAFSLTAATALPIVALLAIVGTAAFVPAWYLRQAEVKRAFCQRNLLALRAGLSGYARRFPGVDAPSLQALVDTGFAEGDQLVCRARPDRKEGYLYVPGPAVPPESWKIWVCDRRGNHGKLRMVLFNDGRILAVGESEFRELLAKPENAAMGKLVEAER